MIEFGTEENPVRCSSLPMLLTCGGFAVLKSLYEDTSGTAALVGTAVGRGVELWHLGTDVEEAVKIALGEVDGCLGPKEELEISKTVEAYAQDVRNGELALTQVLPESLELVVKFEYKGVWFSGHTDQIRRHDHDGKLYVWDLKHTKRYTGPHAVNAYAAQLAAYAYGSSIVLDEPVGVGGIVRTTGYISPKKVEQMWVSERPVFFPAPWRDGLTEELMDQVVARVERINGGNPDLCSGQWCGFCPAQGIANCGGMLEVLK